MPTCGFSTPVTLGNKHRRKEDPTGRTSRELYPRLFSFTPLFFLSPWVMFVNLRIIVFIRYTYNHTYTCNHNI